MKPECECLRHGYFILFQVRECIVFKKWIENCRINCHILKSIVITRCNRDFQFAYGRIIEGEIIYLDDWEVCIEPRLIYIDTREKCGEIRSDICDISTRQSENSRNRMGVKTSRCKSESVRYEIGSEEQESCSISTICKSEGLKSIGSSD